MAVPLAAPLPDISFSGLAIVAGVAFLVPLALSVIPWLRVPSAVFEILAGIVIGPQVLGWVQEDVTIKVLSLIGLGVLLFLSGLEIDFTRLRGLLLRLTLAAYGVSLGLALLLSYSLREVGVIRDAGIVAIILTSTSLGIMVPLLKDLGLSASTFGQLVLAAASLGELIPVILLSLLFSGRSESIRSQSLLLGLFVILTLVVLGLLLTAGRATPLSALMRALQDTTAQIRIRGMFVLLAAFGAIAVSLGLAGILGAFIAGAIVKLSDRGGVVTAPGEHAKLDAIGYGVFIPVFWVTTGLEFDVLGLTAGPGAILRVPLFLAALLLARGLPALLYARLVGRRGAVATGFLQATSLSFVVVAASLGQSLGLLRTETSAALIAAALLSALIYPAVALVVMPRATAAAGEPAG